MNETIRGYLLDTNILSFWADPKRQHHQNIIKRIEALGDSPLCISAITLGEIAYGHLAASSSGETPIQSKFNNFIRNKFPTEINVLEVDRHTADPFGRLRAGIFEKYTKKDGRHSRRLYQLVNPDDFEPLGVQENDLWIAAQALQYNLVLVTNDKMLHIKSIAQDLKVEDWLEDKETGT